MRQVLLVLLLSSCGGGEEVQRPASDPATEAEVEEMLLSLGYVEHLEASEPQEPYSMKQMQADVHEAQEDIQDVEQKLDELLLRLEQAHPVEYEDVRKRRLSSPRGQHGS